jgi:hypothetical protein
MPIENLSDPQVFCVDSDAVDSLDWRMEKKFKCFPAEEITGTARRVVIWPAMLAAKIAIVIMLAKAATDKPFRSAIGIRKNPENVAIIAFCSPS